MRKYSKEEYIKIFKSIHGETYSYDKFENIGANKTSIITCMHHGDFLQRPNDHKIGYGCPYCARQLVGLKCRKSQDKFIQKANEVHDYNYIYDKAKYINAHTKVIITCRKHGDFMQTPADHCNHMRGCPICKRSKGELIIRNFLKEHNIQFKEQYKFIDCKSIRPLPFDFYLTKLNVLIEYQGKQHYMISSWHTQEQLKQLQQRDKIKFDFCISNNIQLLLISYKDNIKEKLNTIFL